MTSAAARARALADQVMVHAGGRQQARDRRRCRASTPRSDRMRIVWPVGDRLAGLRAAARSSARSSPRRLRAASNSIGSVTDLKPRGVDVAQLGQLVVVEDRVLDA